MHGIFPQDSTKEPADIRSVPAVYNHMIEYLPGMTESSCKRIKKSWLEFYENTWMDDEYLSREKSLKLAQEKAQHFSGREKEVFLLGLGAHKDCLKIYEKIIAKDQFAHLNPLEQSKDVRCSVYLIHGKHDELIPASQQSIIKESLPKEVIKRAFLTKLYAHSQKTSHKNLVARIYSMISEIKNMIRIILTLSLPKARES